MRLTTLLAIVWPESCRLEPQQPLRLYVTGLDAEYTTGRQRFPDDRKNAAFPLAMQDEGFAYRLKNIVCTKQCFDLIFVEQQKSGFI